MPRALLPVHHHLSLTAKILLKNDSQTAEEIIGSFIQAKLDILLDLYSALTQIATA